MAMAAGAVTLSSLQTGGTLSSGVAVCSHSWNGAVPTWSARSANAGSLPRCPGGGGGQLHAQLRGGRLQPLLERRRPHVVGQVRERRQSAVVRSAVTVSYTRQ